jgi:soluble lytic murein transglycosylase-like protein
LLRFCFRIGWAVLAAAALWGADGTAERPVRMTSVVRSDPRTGKLVRSVVVTAKSVTERKVAENVVTPRVITPAGAALAAAELGPGGALEGAASPAGFQEAVDRIAGRHGLSPELLNSMIQVESNYNPYAVSPKGALGIMQLIPATARRFGVSDVFDPAENIEGGARYLKYLLQLFNGNYPLALAAYNAGENAVAKYGDVPPYPETRTYLKLVAKRLEEAQKASAAKVKEQKEVKPAEPKSDGNHVREVMGADGTVRYVSR